MQHTNTFSRYIRELASSRYQPLDFEAERILLKEYIEEGSTQAFAKLVQSNLRFVPYVINRNFSIPDSIDMMDVIQEGNLGIIEGVKRFDMYKFQCRVYSYCSYWVFFYINVFLEKHQKAKVIFSYDSIEDDKKDSLEFDQVEFNNTELAGDVCKDIIETYFYLLQDREKFILVQFFGLHFPHTPRTLQEIGSMLHVNLERVRQLKERALEKIRNQLSKNR